MLFIYTTKKIFGGQVRINRIYIYCLLLMCACIEGIGGGGIDWGAIEMEKEKILFRLLAVSNPGKKENFD